jgi:hypothetical protein
LVNDSEDCPTNGRILNSKDLAYGGTVAGEYYTITGPRSAAIYGQQRCTIR